MTLFRKQWSHPLVHFVHQIIYDDDVSLLGIQRIPVWQARSEFYASYGLVQWLVFSVTPQDTVRYRRHHVHHVFHKSVHRDRISTSVGSEITLVKGCIHGMKWFGSGPSAHTKLSGSFVGMIQKSVCFPLYFVLLLLWGKHIWLMLLLLLWGKRIWLLLLLWGKPVWLLLLWRFKSAGQT